MEARGFVPEIVRVDEADSLLVRLGTAWPRIETQMRQKYIWNLPRTPIPLGDRTAVMGILNVTPDSFSDPGQYFDRDKAIARGKEMEQEGADIIDVGGESTRPGNEAVSEEEETRRVIPVIEALVGAVKIPISTDTWRSGVARRSLEAGAQIVNDISGLRFDSDLPRVISDAVRLSF